MIEVSGFFQESVLGGKGLGLQGSSSSSYGIHCLLYQHDGVPACLPFKPGGGSAKQWRKSHPPTRNNDSLICRHHESPPPLRPLLLALVVASTLGTSPSRLLSSRGQSVKACCSPFIGGDTCSLWIDDPLLDQWGAGVVANISLLLTRREQT